mgnify:CR=1 FL=1
MSQSEQLTLATWNMRCDFEISSSYMKELSESAQFILIQEHGLFPCEIYKLDKGNFHSVI